MGMRRLAAWLVAVAVLFGPLPCAAAPAPADDIARLLRQAEASRSADPDAFKEVLARLNAGQARATARQKQEITWLNAYAEGYAGRFDQAIAQARSLIATTGDASLKFRSGALIINLAALNGHYNDGLRQIEQTLALLDRIHDPELRQHGVLAAASLYNQIGQYELARRYADMVLPAPASQRMLCFAGYLKADALAHLQDLPGDDEQALEAVDQCRRARETMMANLVRATLARKWVRVGKPDRAFAMLQQYLPEAQSTAYPRVIAEFRSLLGELAYARGDLAGAEANAKQVATYSAGLSNTPPLVAAYRTLYRIADQRRDLAAALSYYRQYSEAERGYLMEVKARELAYQLVRQENLQKNQQIELLNRRNRLLQLQQQVDRQSAENSRLIILLLGLLALSIGYWAYKTRRLHASLRRMAETDALTGIGNRHHFTGQAERTLAQCVRSGEQVALVMFDLDHFKSINDNFGHNTGDWVLKRVGVVAAAFCRSIDHFGRLGGEEFAILLRGCSLRDAVRMAEDCRVRIGAIPSRESGHNFPISASFGVSVTALSGNDLDRLISHADQALYRSKREGRNRVRAYERELPIELSSQGVTVLRPEASRRDAAAESGASVA